MSIVQKYMHYYTTQRKPETAVVLACASCSETPMMLVFIYLQLKVTESRGVGVDKKHSKEAGREIFQRNGWEMVMWEGGESGRKNSQVHVITEDHFCSSFGIIKKKKLLIWKRKEKIVPGVCDAAFALYLLKKCFSLWISTQMENGWKLNITNIVIIPALIHQVKHTHMQTQRPIYWNILDKIWVCQDVWYVSVWWYELVCLPFEWRAAFTSTSSRYMGKRQHSSGGDPEKNPIDWKNRQETRTQGGTQRKHMACTHGDCC